MNRDDRAELDDLRGLRDAVVRAITEVGDDLCWMDLYRVLAERCDIPFDPLLLPRARMLGNCERFVDSLLAGCPYGVDRLTEAAIQHGECRRRLDPEGRHPDVPLVELVADVQQWADRALDHLARHGLESLERPAPENGD